MVRRARRRVTIAVVLAAGAACASSTASTPTSTADVPMLNSPMRLRGDVVAAVSQLPFDLERVWRELPLVLDSLGIPTTELDARRHVIGNASFKAHKRLGRVALSKLIDCGSTQGFPSADEYEVTLSVLVELARDAAGPTNVTTRVEAAGRPMAFPGAFTRCSTKGQLERSIVDALTNRLQG